MVPHQNNVWLTVVNGGHNKIFDFLFLFLCYNVRMARRGDVLSKSIFMLVGTLVLCQSAMAVTNPTISRLINEKNSKLEQLEQCAKKMTGFKIAGISTLGLTAIGVGGNIALASKRKALDEQIKNTKNELASKNAELEQILAQIPVASPTTTETTVPDNGKDFSLICENYVGEDCKIIGKKIPVLKHSCEKNMKIEPGNPIFLPLSGNGISECYEQIHDLLGAPDVCDVRRIAFEKPEHSMLIFCTDDANVIYTNKSGESNSYAEKKCVGSMGEWKNNQCSCPLRTHLEKGECLCDTNTGFKYPYNNFGQVGCDWDHGDDEKMAFICGATGGRIANNGKCVCPSTMELNSVGTFCVCKSGTDYTDPTRKSLGCERK